MKSAKEMFKDAWSVFKNNWTTLLLVSIGVGILGYIFNNLLPLLGGALGKWLFSLNTATWYSILIGMVAVVVVLAWIIASIVISTIRNLVPLYLFTAFDEEKKLEFKSSARELIRLTPKYLWVVILTGVIVVGGFVLLLIPGLYFAVLFSFALWAFLIDGKRGVAALAYSASLFKGRFWKVLGKSMYPALYALGLIIIAAAISVPTWMFIPSMWIKVPILIVVGIAFLVAFFILYGVSLAYSVKLYKSLRPSTGEQSDTPSLSTRWIKVWAIVGLVVSILLAGIGMFLAINNPEFKAEFMKGYNESRHGAANNTGSLVGTDESKVYEGYGLYFRYPGRFVDTGVTEMKGSIATFTDTKSPSVSTGYMPQIALLAFEPKEEVSNLSILDILKKNFVPDFEAGKTAGEVLAYSLKEEKHNGYTFAVIESSEMVEGQRAVTRTIAYKNKKAIYLFQGIALESEKDAFEAAISEILAGIEISE